MTTKTITITASIVAAIVLLLLVAANYFYNFAILRKKKTFLKDNPDLQDGSPDGPVAPWAEAAAWLKAKPCETLTGQSDEGLGLRACFLEAPSPTADVAILVHGYTGQGQDMAAFATMYREELGFHVLMPDCRGHGGSEGRYIGFGWHDRRDLLRWIDRMIERIGPEARIVLHGISMGGAAVLMASGESLPPQVKAIVSDCAYSSAKDIFTYQLRRMFKLPPFPLIPITSLICKWRAGYFFGEASALKQVGKTHIPILYIHGGDDTFVPTHMVYPLYEETASDKRLFVVPHAGHGWAYWTDREGYTRQVETFVHAYVRNEPYLPS